MRQHYHVYGLCKDFSIPMLNGCAISRCFIYFLLTLEFLILPNGQGSIKRLRLVGEAENHHKTTRMKMIAVLLLVLSCCLCEAQFNDQNVKAPQCSESTSCCSLLSMSQTLGAVGEKVANMADKLAHLELQLQSTQKEVLELRSLTGGKTCCDMLHRLCGVDSCF